MDYSQLSDFEINKRVSVAAGLNVNMFFDVDEAYARGPVWTAPSGNCYAGIKSSKGNPFDPCNDPEDAWPIIKENNITLILQDGISPCAISGVNTGICFEIEFERRSQGENPLRQAMIVFLMMQDAKHA